MKFTRVEPKPHIKLRIIATLIDYSIYFFVFGVCMFVFSTPGNDGRYTLNGALALLPSVIWVLYFPGTEALNGATPGHDICKLTVVTKAGGRVSFSVAFKRRLCDLIDLFACYGIVALICVSKTEKHQRIGDLWAGTLVVKKADIAFTEVEF